MAVSDGLNPDDPAFVRYPGGVPFGVCWEDKYADKARAAIEATGYAELVEALNLALAMLIKYEPPDSRAVSNEYVAMAAVACGIGTDADHALIRAAITRAGGDLAALSKPTGSNQ